MPHSSEITVGLCQYAPEVGAVEGNRRLGSEWINRAADQGAGLVLLPELAASGYTYQRELEAAASSQATDGPTILEWASICRRRSVWAAAGFAESGRDGRYNSAVLLGPDGVVGVYRKAHLFNDEKLYFLPGDLGFPVFDLPFGRLGMLICYDLWFPEAARILALKGADVILVPTNWVANFRRRPADERGWTMGDYACVGAATQNQIFIAAADRIGEERGVEFVGCSCLVGPDGSMLAGPASLDAEALITVKIDTAQARRAKRRTPRNDTLADRRPELYAELAAGLTETSR